MLFTIQSDIIRQHIKPLTHVVKRCVSKSRLWIIVRNLRTVAVPEVRFNRAREAAKNKLITSVFVNVRAYEYISSVSRSSAFQEQLKTGWLVWCDGICARTLSGSKRWDEKFYTSAFRSNLITGLKLEVATVEVIELLRKRIGIGRKRAFYAMMFFEVVQEQRVNLKKSLHKVQVSWTKSYSLWNYVSECRVHNALITKKRDSLLKFGSLNCQNMKPVIFWLVDMVRVQYISFSESVHIYLITFSGFLPSDF